MRTLFERVLDKLEIEMPEVMKSEHIANAKYMIDNGTAEVFLNNIGQEEKLFGNVTV